MSSNPPQAVRGGRLAERPASRTEQSRRRIVALVFCVYWLLIFEGALRKWLLPQFQQEIFFARDPIVLLIYVLAWRTNIVKRDGLLRVGAALALLFVPLMVAQLASSAINPLTLFYGWRMYFFYLPLIFVIKDAFKPDDIYRLIRQTLYVSIPLSVLVYVQYISPPMSFINAAYSTSGVFIVANNIVRTTGTFTFTAGQTMFSASLVAMLIFSWLYRGRVRVVPLVWLVVATGAGIVTLLLSGSRTAFFMSGLVVLASFIGLLFTRSLRRKTTGIAILLVLVLSSVLLFTGPFSESLDALSTRFEQAEHGEGSAVRRAVAPLFLFTDRILTAPIEGVGLGYGTTGGTFLTTGKAQLLLPEDEWSRVIMEVGPIFGLLYIGYRIVFACVLLVRCVRSARADNLLPFIFLGFIGFYLLAGNVTQTGTVHGYNWIFVGLTMAAMKTAARRKTSRAAVPVASSSLVQAHGR